MRSWDAETIGLTLFGLAIVGAIFGVLLALIVRDPHAAMWNFQKCLDVGLEYIDGNCLSR